MRKHRPYGTADTFSRRLRRILFGFCRPIAESYAAKTMGRTSNYLDRRPLPRHGGGERGCEAERRQWRMQRGGAPAAVEKIEQASSAKIFSGTARRQGLRFAEEAVLQTVKYLLNLPHSSPPLRRGQGRWFALLRSSAGAIKMRRRHLISTV